MNEDMKQSWKDASFCTSPNSSINEIIHGQRTTALQNLARRYKWFSNLGLLMILWSIILPLSNMFDVTATQRMILALSFGIYFLTTSVMDRWLYQRVSEINISTMGVKQVSDRALLCRKRHLQFMIVLIPMAILCVGELTYFSLNNEYLIYGIICGFLIGLATGSFQFMKFMADYRRLRD